MLCLGLGQGDSWPRSRRGFSSRCLAGITVCLGHLPPSPPPDARQLTPARRMSGTVRTVLRAGANPNELCPRGWAAVHLASTRREALEAVLEYGGDVNLQTLSGGDTPLHLAASQGRVECVKLCLAHGVSPKAPKPPRVAVDPSSR